MSEFLLSKDLALAIKREVLQQDPHITEVTLSMAPGSPVVKLNVNVLLTCDQFMKVAQAVEASPLFNERGPGGPDQG